MDLSGGMYSTFQLDLVNQNSLTDYLQNGTFYKVFSVKLIYFVGSHEQGLIIGMAFVLSHLFLKSILKGDGSLRALCLLVSFESRHVLVISEGGFIFITKVVF